MPVIERRCGIRSRIDGVPITRHWDVGPLGLTLWSWPLTTAATVRVPGWVIEWHPRATPRLARPNILVRRAR